MLWCVCSVIDHSWCQIVVRTKEWHLKGSQMCHRCDRKSIGLNDKKKQQQDLVCGDVRNNQNVCIIHLVI